jgi:hypothetical protein
MTNNLATVAKKLVKVAAELDQMRAHTEADHATDILHGLEKKDEKAIKAASALLAWWEDRKKTIKTAEMYEDPRGQTPKSNANPVQQTYNKSDDFDLPLGASRGLKAQNPFSHTRENIGTYWYNTAQKWAKKNGKTHALKQMQQWLKEWLAKPGNEQWQGEKTTSWLWPIIVSAVDKVPDNMYDFTDDKSGNPQKPVQKAEKPRMKMVTKLPQKTPKIFDSQFLQDNLKAANPNESFFNKMK